MPAAKKNNLPQEVLDAYNAIIDNLKDIERKGATMPYTSVNGHMFSFIGADGIVGLRLPADSREAFIQKHKTKLCEAHGTVLKEYVAVPGKLLKETIALTAYFKESLEYVQSLKPKATKATVKKSLGENGKSRKA